MKNPQVKDLRGQNTGHWKVLGEGGRASNNEVMWKCQCVCGTLRYIRGAKIRQGKSNSCGCVSDKSDIAGKQYGEWKVICRTRDHKNQSKWLCSNGDMMVMMSTTHAMKGNIIITEDVQRWKMVGTVGMLMGDGRHEWIVGSSCPGEKRVLAECPETGLIAIFDESQFGDGMFPVMGRYKKPQRENLIGKDILSWTVIDTAKNNSHGQVMWKCQCHKCGIVKDIASFYLKRGATCMNCHEIFGKNEEKENSEVQEN